MDIPWVTRPYRDLYMMFFEATNDYPYPRSGYVYMSVYVTRNSLDPKQWKRIKYDFECVEDYYQQVFSDATWNQKMTAVFRLSSVAPNQLRWV